MRETLALLVITLGALMLGGPALASEDAAGEAPSGRVLAATVTSGEKQQFYTDCFVPGTAALVTVSGGSARVSVNDGPIGSENHAEGTVNADGALTADIRADDAGTYTVTAAGTRTCAAGAASASFTVSGGDAGPGGGVDDGAIGRAGSAQLGGSAGSTGFGAATLAAMPALGIAFVGVGAAALVAARRRAASKD